MSITLPLISSENYRFLKQYILQQSGIVVDDGKEYFLSTRLESVMREQKLANLDALCMVLRKAPNINLRQAIVESVTIHETSFFRDETAFEAMKMELLPRLIAARPAHSKIRVWSAASSSGQEPFSLAMMMLELGIDKSQIEILATDLSGQIIERAQKGIYTKVEVQRGISNHRMRHFVPHPEGWQLSEEIRRMVRFTRMDLRNIPPSKTLYDLVVCRNVLIYFDMKTKLQILKSMVDVMAPEGYLLLGTAESLVNLDINLELKLVRNSRFYQRRAQGNGSMPQGTAGGTASAQSEMA